MDNVIVSFVFGATSLETVLVPVFFFLLLLLFFFCAFSMSSVKFLTLNGKGLRNQEKRRSIISYLKKQKANILQRNFP